MIFLVREAIKQYLISNGIKQSYLAEKIGMSAPTLSALLNGKRSFEIEEYVNICKVLKLPYDFFMPIKA